MIDLRTAAYAAIAAACLAHPAVAQDRMPVTARVRYSDLNLGTAEGRAALRSRISGVASALCPDMAGTLEQKMDSQHCRGEVMKDGDQQVARLTTPSDHQLALAQPR